MDEIVIKVRGNFVQESDNITIKVNDEEIKFYVLNTPDEDYAINVRWSVVDILKRAKEKGILLTTQEAIEILDNIKHDYAAELGITWNIVDCYIGAANEIDN